MGIETATLVAMGTALSGAAAAYSAITNKPQKPDAPATMKPPVESKTPDSDVFRKQNQQAGRGGNAATMLAPLGGVPNSTLNLGRNTLLGA